MSRELEEKFNQKLKLAGLDKSTFVFDEEEKEEEVNDFPNLTPKQCEDIQMFMYGRDNGQVCIKQELFFFLRIDHTA